MTKLIGLSPLISALVGLLAFHYLGDGNLLFFPLIITLILSEIYSVLIKKSYSLQLRYTGVPSYLTGRSAVQSGLGSIIAGILLFLFWFVFYK